MATTALKQSLTYDSINRAMIVRDLTSWETDEKPGYGMAVFLYKDGTPVQHNLKDYTFDIWAFAISDTGTYKSALYAIAKYASGTSYDTGDIVISKSTSEGIGDQNIWKFYRSKTDANVGNDPASDTVNWEDLSDVAIATVEGYFTATPPDINAPVAEEKVKDLGIQLTKAECYKWNLKNNTSSTKYVDIYTFEAYQQGSSALNSSTLTMAASATLSILLEDTYSVTDGVYVVLVYSDSSKTELFTHKIIYEFCALRACFKSLTNDVFCSDCECETECDQDDIEIIKRKRRDLQRMTALFGMFMLYVHAEKDYTYNYFSLDQRKEELVARASNILEKLNTLVTRCGECS